MVKRDVIHKRLKRLDEYLTILHSLQKYSYKEFIKNPELYGSTERFYTCRLKRLMIWGIIGLQTKIWVK